MGNLGVRLLSPACIDLGVQRQQIGKPEGMLYIGRPCFHPLIHVLP